jgi:hypothetical protein
MLKMCQRGANPSEQPNNHNSNSGMHLKVDKGSPLSKNAVQAIARWLAGRR